MTTTYAIRADNKIFLPSFRGHYNKRDLTNDDIKLYPHILDKARNGKKRATTRKGIKPYCVGPTKLRSTEDETDFLKVFVTKVEVMTFGQLHDNCELGEIEGYQNTSELIGALKTIYPDIEKNDFITVAYYDIF